MITLLADANNIAVRSVLAPNHDMSVGSIETGALVLFLNTLSRYVRIQRPDRALVCWDSGRSSFRTRMFPQYKANRKQKATDLAAQPIALMQTFLKLAGVPQLQLPGYEGDDLIAASWRACRGRERIFILSSDKDMLQLIEDGTEQIKLVTNSSRPDVWSRTRFIKELGFKPEYQAYVLALTGDSSDGIPGLSKVGPKTAVKMLAAANWDMGRLVDSLPQDQQDIVLRNIALIDLSCVPLDLPAPPLFKPVTPDHEDWPALEAFCDRWELQQIKTKLLANKLWTD